MSVEIKSANDNRIVVKVNYPGFQHYPGHSHEIELIPAGSHCPNCGSCDTWVEDDEGDYYVGPTYYCPSCGEDGHMWESGGPSVIADAIYSYRSGESMDKNDDK